MAVNASATNASEEQVKMVRLRDWKLGESAKKGAEPFGFKWFPKKLSPNISIIEARLMIVKDNSPHEVNLAISGSFKIVSNRAKQHSR